MENQGGIVKGKLHSECNITGCGVKYKIDGNPNKLAELERDEAILFPSSFAPECFSDSFCEDPAKYKMTGTISQIASAINSLGGNKDFDSGAKVIKNGRRMNKPRLTYRNKYMKGNHLPSGSVIINRTNMLNPEVMTFKGTAYEIASQINSYGGNGVKLDERSGHDNLREGGKIESELEAGLVYSIMPSHQRMIVSQYEEDLKMEILNNIAENLNQIPKLYGQDGKGKNSVVYLHYFINNNDWYITELDSKTKEGFGYVVLNGDYQFAELGYISIKQLTDATNIELDFYWTPKTINEILEKNAPEFVTEPIQRYKQVDTDNAEFFKGVNADYDNAYNLNRAIEEFLRSIEGKNKTLTEDELKFIDQYSGYGNLEEFGEINEDELKGLKYEFYTPDPVIKKMWALAYKYGYGSRIGTDIVETSAGTGKFFQFAPKEGKKVAYETNPVSAKICKMLYPDVEVKNQPFEKQFIRRNLSIGAKTQDLEKYSLCIGNPPYGRISSKYYSMGEDNYSKASNFAEYFIVRGLDLLVSGGLLIFIVGAEQYNGGKLFLGGKMSTAKELIHEKAELIDAYRLPRNIFERTGVSSEIIVFKKR